MDIYWWLVFRKSCYIHPKNMDVVTSAECQDSRQAIPIQVWICTHSQLRRHVFDHLWGDLAPESFSKPWRNPKNNLEILVWMTSIDIYHPTLKLLGQQETATKTWDPMLLHVVWNAPCAQEDSHCTQAFQLELLDLSVQNVRPRIA